jgi:hypothetical protein
MISITVRDMALRQTIMETPNKLITLTPRNVIKEVINENEDNKCSSNTRVGTVTCSMGSQTSPAGEGDQHARSSDKEQWAASNALNKPWTKISSEQVEDLQNTIDNELSLAVGDTDASQHLVNIVRHQAVTRPLREETNTAYEERSLAVTGYLEYDISIPAPKNNRNASRVEILTGINELKPGALSSFLFQTNSFNNFIVFELDKFVIGIAVAMDIGQNSESLFFFVTRNQPSWGFGKGEDEEDLNQRE